MELREGYKQTELGVIPKDWNVAEIGEVSKTSSGTTPARVQGERYYKNGEFHWVKTLDLNNSLIEDTEENVTALALRETCLQMYPIGTVLVAMYGGFNQIGRTGLLGIATSVNQALVAIQLERKKVEPRFLLGTLNYRVEYWKSVASSSRKDPNITSNDVKQFRFPLPPTIAEQTAIADALSDADALIQSLTRLITKKRQIKQGAMQTLLNPYENGRLKAGWVVKKLGDIADVIGGGTPSSFNPSYWNGDIDWYTPTEIGENKYVYESRRKITKEGYSNSSANLLPIGTVLLTSRAGIGDLGILMKEGCTNQGFQSLISKESTDYDFLYYLMGTLKNQLLQNASGSTFLEISPGKLKQIEAGIPQKTEQTRVATILSDMDAGIAALETKLAKTQQIKQGMMQNLLTGKIRLLGTGASAPDDAELNSARLKPHFLGDRLV